MPNDNVENIDAAPPAAPADIGTAPAPVVEASAPAAAATPKTMLEAIEATLPAAAPVTDKPADDAPPAAAATADAAKPALDKDGKPVETPPAAAEDITQMPDGLSTKAQERFQKLANSNKELTTKYDEVTQAVEPFRKALQDNGVQREQFDQAASVIGMMNRGDLPGALAVLDEQRRLISLAMGKPLPGVDTLQGFDDLRQAVDQFQITEERAIEIARARGRENHQRQQQERQQSAQQTQDQTQQQHVDAVQDVDRFCAEMQKNDLDYAKIEAILQPQIGALIDGVPPAKWKNVVEQAYKMIKNTSAATRQAAAPAVQTLRPHGGGSPATQPKTMFDAMFPGT